MVAKPRLGSRTFAIRTIDGGLIGVVGHDLQRFRANGINCGRFKRGVWYRLPSSLTTALRTFTTGLRPAELRATIPRSC